MMIALFANLARDNAKALSLQIKDFLISKNVRVISEKEVADVLNTEALENIDLTTLDFVITLGGDGTIIRALHRHPEITAPVLGINHGSLGFMADIPVTEIKSSLETLLSGDYAIQERSMLDGVKGEEKAFALNDIILHRAEFPSLIEFSICIDEIYLNTFSADGMIISTANGSTAYSLAAGGPIVSPELKCVVLTPICPHTISNRPIVIQPKKLIELKYLIDTHPAEVTFDGFSRFKINAGETLAINPSARKFNLVLLKGHEYYSTLRSKLGWSGKLKNRQS